jgi:hypothetical protein
MVVFCSGCGNNVSVGERFCAVCGQEVSAASAPAPAFGPPAEGTIFPAQTSGKAIASLVCDLFLFAFPLSILAVIFGHLFPRFAKAQVVLKARASRLPDSSWATLD